MKRKKATDKKQVKRVTLRLSLCMIAKDEANFLAQCLASVKGLADEVIVGDTGSSDGTRAVAERAGARVLDVPWTGDFSAARNAVLAEATGDWILILDCDEALAKRDHAVVRKAMRSGRAMGYRMTTRNYATASNREGWRACDGAYKEEKSYPGWFPTTKVRLFQNDARIRFRGALHELVEGAIEAVGGPVADCLAPVHHYGYVEKARPDALYAEMAQKKAADDPQDAEAFYQLALSQRDAGDLEGARAAIDRCLALIGSGNAGGAYLRQDFAHLVKGDISQRLGDPAAEDLAYLSALSVNPACFQALNNLGALRQRQDRLDEALAYYEWALELAPDVETIRENVRRVGKAQEKRKDAKTQGREGEGERGGDSRPATRDPRLSLCMIAKNEGHRIGRCLESVQGLVDEIVVVDTGSTDDTVAIAEKYGAKIGYFEWCDDFAAARNASLALATGDWLMWLDPDDLLPKECHAKIREVMRRGPGKAYYFVLDDQGYEPVRCLQMRLFPNLPGVKFVMPIHEQVTPSLAELGVVSEATDIRVVHTGYSSPEVVKAKQVRYLGIMEKWLEKHPEDYIVRSHAALTYYIRGPLDRAIENYQRILDEGQAKKDRNLVILTTATLYMGRCYMRKEDYEKALPYLLEAEKLDDQYAVTLLTMGECYTRMNRPEDALLVLDRAMMHEGQTTFSATDPVSLRYSIRFFKGQNLEALGRLEEAAQWYAKAAEVDEKRGGALGNLSRVYRHMGRREEAVAAIEKALAAEPEDAQHRFNRGAFCLEAGQMVEAVRWFRKALEVNPDMPEAYLNLGYVARREGDFKTAEAMYRRAIERQARGCEAQANLAHLLLDQGRYAEAGALFEQVRTQRTGLLDIALGLCAVHAFEGRIGGVRTLLGEVLPAVYGERMAIPDGISTGDLAALLAECGRMLVQKQQAACAKLAYLSAHLLDGKNEEIAMQLAEVYRTTGDIWKAVAIYEAQIRQRPGVLLFQKLGACYEALGVGDAAQMCRTQAAAMAGLAR